MEWSREGQNLGKRSGLGKKIWGSLILKWELKWVDLNEGYRAKRGEDTGRH